MKISQWKWNQAEVKTVAILGIFDRGSSIWARRILGELKNNELRAPKARSPPPLGGQRERRTHFRAFEIKWGLFRNIFQWLFIHKNLLKFEFYD